MSELLALGVSHHTAPVALRERLALVDSQAVALLHDLVADAAIAEAVVISTCNRTEAYLVVDDPVAAETALLGRLATQADLRPTELAAMAYTPRNCDAARQLFRVAAALDSMIVGEAEVQGQVRHAYERARAAGTTGPLTNRLFTAALSAGKRVRSETRVGEGGASISSVAVDLARGVVGELSQRDVLVIGAGETAELTARALAQRGVRTIFLANRHAARARSLAERFGGSVLSLDQLPGRMEAADIVVASLRAQVDAGAAAVQVFDSWAGLLSPADYRRSVLPATRRIFAGLEDLGVPRIHFGVGTGELLELLAEAGPDVVGVDWRVPLDQARARLGEHVSVQGNLDPAVCLAPWDVVARETSAVLDANAGRPGHVFN
ncbi:MAG: glutamyl-tRNA reductase, partial [Actinobacteria bacterium]|nr:glutamyl-tRNA reductase [Actinomycetota bacterium]